MQLTPNFRLRKPDGTDPVDVKDLNDNMDVLDTEVAKKMDKTGDASNAVAKFSQAGSRTNLTSGEKLSLSLGKAMKWFADLKTVAFSGSYSDLSGKPSIPSGTAASCGVANNDTTTASGFVADARIVKTHGDEIDTLNQNLGGYKFSVIDGIPSYKVGADTAWVPLGSGIYYIADYGELAAYGTSPKTYTIPVPDYVKSRVAASVYNNADNYVGLADTVVGIAPGGIPGNHHHPSTLTVNDGVITITVGAKGASYYVQPRGKIYLVTGSIIKA